MKRKKTLVLAIVGTSFLVLLFGVTLVYSAGIAKLEWVPYLMVASMDLLPLAALGGLLLVWAALLAASHRLPVCLGFGMAAAGMLAGMILQPVPQTQGWSLVGLLVIGWWMGMALAAGAGVSLVLSLLREVPESSTAHV
jgi:hypothetical protein